MKTKTAEVNNSTSDKPYLPLARRLRPQTFAEVIGQEVVTRTLQNAIKQNRLVHAYLVTGPRGVGKTSTARILAKALNCERGPSPEPCNACTTCQEVTAGRSLDVLEIDGASNRGIDEIRALRENVKLSPARGKFKLYIIDEVHQITADAFNALLKTLEEPPAHVKFIFATTHPQKVPATILSRCQRFDFKPLPSALMVQTLQAISQRERLAVEPEALQTIAQAADGSLRDAETLLDQLASFTEPPITEGQVRQLLGWIPHADLDVVVRHLLERETTAVLRWIESVSAGGYDWVQVMGHLVWYCRQLFIAKTVQHAAGADRRLASTMLTTVLDVPPDRVPSILEHAERAGTDEWLYIMQLLIHAYDLLKRSALPRVHVEVALLKLAQRESLVPVAELVRQLEQRLDVRPPPQATLPPATVNAEHAPPFRAGQAGAASAAAPSAQPAAPPPAVAHAVPAETSAAAPALSFEEAERHWPQLIERVAEQKVSIGAYLSEGRPVGCQGATLEIEMPSSALHREVLEQPQQKQLIEQTARQVWGVPSLHIRYVAPSAAPAPDAAASGLPPIVETALKLFGGTLLNPAEARGGGAG